MKQKILTKLVIAILITIIIAFISQALMPILGNDAAIGQLENDDFYFIAMNTWYQANLYLGGATAIVWVICSIGIFIDVYKYIKTKKENGENK